MQKITIIQDAGYEYLEEGQGEPLVLLHGLFGALSNWQEVLDCFSKDMRVLIPLLPIYKNSRVEPSVEGLAQYVAGFIQHMGLQRVHLVGNSLGGHVALVYTLQHMEEVASMTLTGSSGLFEAGMGSTFPRRGDYNYIRERTAFTFYDPACASKELVDEVFDIVNDGSKALRILKLARNAQRMNLARELGRITTPTCLIWGLNDTITPPYVAHEFHRLLPHSELHFIDKCCHAPMMEHPAAFNHLLVKFLQRQHALVL